MIGGHVDVTPSHGGCARGRPRDARSPKRSVSISPVYGLSTLESEFFITDSGERQITVTFCGPCAACGQAPRQCAG